jgi:predicted P-loop ATPase/5S rRNA maturation endonuclease (ribonuclease M5)
MRAEDIAKQLGNAKPNGDGWICRCPAHDDANPSLSLCDSTDGDFLWHCFAGCSQEQVQKALSGLGLLKPHERSVRDKPDKTIEVIYDYYHSDGTLLYQVVRYKPKTFRQRRPDGIGKWIWNLQGIERVPYRLPELVASSGKLVLIAEGEKAVEALRSLDFVATCSPGGAGKWRPTFASHFADRDVVILPDNDDTGERHAKYIAENLLGVAASVKIARLPNLPSKGDPYDWVNAGGTQQMFYALIDSIEPLMYPANEDWPDVCQMSANGQPLSNLANVMLALRHDPAWRGVIGFDEMRQQVMLLQPISIHGSPLVRSHHRPRQWTDMDDTVAQEWLQLAGLKHASHPIVSQAISQRADELRFHPLRDWLQQLTWDGIPRIRGGTTDQGDIIDPWLMTYLGAVDTPYLVAVSAMWLISAVARIFEPGCKVDHTLILEGSQGSGKSTACRILCGEEFFSDALPEIGTKDGAVHLTGKWIIEMAELDAMSRADTAAAKAFLSRCVDKFRPPYGRREINMPRQCVFVGTTNKKDYLKDETGGRRYWPVRTGNIDLVALERDRQQLWAEAVYLYRSGHPWHITDPKLLEAAQHEQEDRYEGDAWEDQLANFLSDKKVVTVSEALKALGFDTQRMDRTAQNRVTRILIRLGWERGKRKSWGRIWIRPEPNNGHDVTE